MTEPVVGAPGAMVVIISGPSGVGKDTVIQHLRELHATPGRHFVVTYKSRPPRDQETDGVHYNFVSDDGFMRLRDEGRFLEATEVHGHWSATPRDQVVEAVCSGRDAILKIDVKGADVIKGMVPEALRIFVRPPSLEHLLERLKGRGTDSPEDVERRTEDAVMEMERSVDYDYSVVNEDDKAAETARAIDRILRHEHANFPDRRISL